MKTTRSSRLTYINAAALLISILGCAPSLIGEDSELRFQMSYGESFHPDTPIALGATLDLVAQRTVSSGEFLAVPQHRSATVLDVTSSDPTVLSVDAIDDARISVTGTSVGSGELEIQALDPTTGDVLRDTLRFEVEVPGQIPIEAECHVQGDPLRALYTPGATIELGYDVMTAGGTRMRGEGYEPLAPGTLTGATLEATESAFSGDALRLIASDTIGPIDFDLKVGANPLSLEVIDPASVDGFIPVELWWWGNEVPDEEDRVLYVFEDTDPAEDWSAQILNIRPTRGGELICGGLKVASAASLTPATCTASLPSEAELDQWGSFVDRDASVDIRALSQGECELEVSLEGAPGPLISSITIKDSTTPE